MASNGKLPASALTKVGPGYLEAGAASRFIAMQQEARRLGLTVPELSGANSGFRRLGSQGDYRRREYGSQWYFWEAYIAGAGNLAAKPGRSNHGWGRAVDLRTPAMRTTVNKIGAKYGWKKVEAPSEWWHVNYVGGGKVGSCWPLEEGCSGDRVKRFQDLLVRLGWKIVADGTYGPKTKHAIRTFQANHRLEADGKIGPSTRKALLKAVAKHPAKRVKPKPTKQPTKLSKKGAAFIAKHEGTILHLYNDPTGHCTIGVGHLVHKGRCNGTEPRSWLNGISLREVVALLRKDADRFAKAVHRAVKVPLSQPEFDALVCWAFNVGEDAMRKSTLIRKLNAGDRRSVPSELARWNKGGGRVLLGLTRRRTAEARLFTDGKY